jgi:MFS transporter, ACS family, solute carrier family 17 (sodium-dependent inorganic phosphate cotransporter), other
MLRKIPQRYSLVSMSMLAVFICYIDRVNMSVAIIPMAEEFGWGPAKQGSVLSSFFVGYLLLQILGGTLADRFGGKIVLGLGVILWSLFTLLTPLAASIGLSILVLNRILMGMGEAVTFPSIYALLARWVPVAERSRAMGVINSGIPLGTVFALIITPIIVQAYGWEWAFYSFAILGFIWAAIWFRIAASDPGKHPRISARELAHIQSDGEPSKTKSAPPVLKLLKSRAIQAIMVAHFCNNWSLFLLLTWLPTFINKGLGVDYSSIGYFTMVPFIASFLCLNIAGGVADRMIKSGMAVIKVRKIMQSISLGGMAAAMMVVGYAETIWVAIAIMTISNALGSAAVGGFVVNHMDIAPKYAGTLMGITNTMAAVPGIIGVYTAGLILELTGSWALVFQLAGAISLFGMLFYLRFASADKQFD